MQGESLEMDPFNFKLESILKHRQFLEDVRQRELSVQTKRVAEARQMEKYLTDKHLCMAEELKKKMQTPRPASENALYATYLACLLEKIGEQRQRVQAAESDQDEKKTALLDAVKKRKMIEQLKKTQVHQFEQFRLKKEQEFSDEVGIQQFNRKAVK